jgi:iron complex transport system permease protein
MLLSSIKVRTEKYILKSAVLFNRTVLVFVAALLVFIILFIIDISTGTSVVGFKEIFNILTGGDGSDYINILTDFRLPRAITAVLAGIALSISGLQMQTVFRNPLAGPYVLGISSGASLGVAILILGFSGGVGVALISAAGNWAIVIAAWIGSGLVLLLIMIVSSRVRDIMTVLILGIMLASAISAVISIMQYLSSESMLKAFVVWTMGSLGNLSWIQIRVLLISIAAGTILSIITVKRLDALVLGEDYARSMGLNVKISRFLVFLSTCILAGSIAAFCGPIAFIGITVPHITRLLLKKSSHKLLLPATILIGANVLLASDIISQLPGSDRILPINSVTALIGIPVIIWIIIRKSRLISIG